MDMNLEVVVVPVSDVDRAKDFYKELGWRVDADVAREPRLPRRADDAARLARARSSSAPASPGAVPGSVDGLNLVVSDIHVARDEIVGHGVESARSFTTRAACSITPAPPAACPVRPRTESYGSFAAFSDPDGNRWLLQQITTRLPGR